MYIGWMSILHTTRNTKHHYCTKTTCVYSLHITHTSHTSIKSWQTQATTKHGPGHCNISVLEGHVLDFHSSFPQGRHRKTPVFQEEKHFPLSTDMEKLGCFTLHDFSVRMEQHLQANILGKWQHKETNPPEIH